MEYVFIINPVSGKGKALKVSKNIIEVCEEANLNYKIHYTTRPKEATEIALEYQNDKKIIYSVGGDGTLLEVLNGVAGTKNLLGVIPAGSGNDFYKVLEDTNKEYISVDIGKVNDLYFINVLSFGIDAETAENANIMKKRKIHPSLIYILSLIYTFLKFKHKSFKFKIDNIEKEGKFTVLTICNGNFYGKGFHIAPYASVKDGLFDIYFVDEIQKLKILKLVSQLKKGTHGSSKYVTRLTSNNVIVSSNEEILCNVDGEIIRGKEFEIELIKDGVNLYNNPTLVREFLK